VKESYADKIDEKISQLRDKDIKDILCICERKRQYPRDCINDGGLYKLASYIVELEKHAPITA